MDFFRSLNEVRKNSSQLDRWEQQQRDKDAQRKAYQAKHAPTPDEIERAKELGETLINVIDVMDDHSESVAENVETATAGISTLTMLAGGGATAYMAWNLGVKANKQLKAARETFDKDKKTQELIEKLNKSAEIRKPNGEVIKNMRFDPHDLRGGKRFLESITDKTLQAEALEMNKTWKNTSKQITKKAKYAWIAVPVVGLVSWFLGNVYETKLQVDSSRIARFQARRELKDPKSFVNYTPEQIAKAKAELDKHPEKLKKDRKDKLKKGLFTSIRELLRDRDNYNRTKKLRDKQQSIVERPLTDAEILQAKKDQEVIQRTIKHLNNRAEKYSEQMETTASVIMNTFPIVGGAIGLGLQLGLEKTGLIKKWVGSFVEKNGSEDAKTTWAAFKDLNKKDPKYKSAWKEFYGELTGIPQTRKQWDKYFRNKSHENLDKEVKKLSNFDAAVKKGKTLLAGQMAHSGKAKWIMGMAAGVLAAFPSAIIALKLQKDASRAGRFTAKRELEKDPTNFIGYADSELDEVKDVKNTDKKESKIKEYALFIPRILRDWWKYNQYRNNDFKRKQALNAELKKLDVTDEQLRDAKNLQAKVFNTFDKVDDKSQAYSEATEAAIETMQPLVYGAGALAMISPLIYFGIQTARGKYTPAKITEKITNVIATSTGILKSKLFKKYLGGVEKNVAHVVNNTDTTKTTLTAALKDIDILETPIGEIISKGVNNARKHFSESFRAMSDQEQIDELHKIGSMIRKNSGEWTSSDDILYNIRQIKNTETRADILDILTLNKESLNAMPAERFDKAKQALLDSLKDWEGNVKTEKLSEAILEIQDKFVQKVLGSKKLGVAQELVPELNELSGKLADKQTVQNALQTILTGVEKVSKDDYMKLVDFADISQYVNGQTIPLQLKNVPGYLEKIADVAKGANAAAQLAGKKGLGDTIFSLDLIADPKKGLSSLANSIKDLDNEAYIKLVSGSPIGGWEKESVVKILNNMSKVWDNIPKEESKRIMSAMIKQFNENPDKFVEAFKSGKIMQMFATPQIKKALQIAGISWVAFTAVMTYVIESWLAEIQLRAGRLGVKSAMDDLQDHRYYANVIPTENTAPVETSTPVSAENNLLAKFKK